jgi:4'-phosphopantetheinyl transferase
LNKSVTTVWVIPLQVTGDQVDACRDLLSEERARAERFVFEWLRRRYIVAHGCTRAILARHTGVPARELRFETTQYGKPFLDRSLNTHFNLSHSSELAILAVGTGELGADVEFIRPLDDFENVAMGFFSVQEVADLHRYAAPDGAVAIGDSQATLETRWWGNCELVMPADNGEDEAKGERNGN